MKCPECKGKGWVWGGHTGEVNETVCHICWPEGGSLDSICLCPRTERNRPLAQGSTISSETAGGN